MGARPAERRQIELGAALAALVAGVALAATPPAEAFAQAGARVLGGQPRVEPSGRVTLRVECRQAGGAGCSGTVALQAWAGTRLARRSFSAEADATRRVGLSLNRAGARLVSRRQCERWLRLASGTGRRRAPTSGRWGTGLRS